MGGNVGMARFRVGTDDGRVGTDRLGGLGDIVELEVALHSRLFAYSGLRALISIRIYPLILPQNPTYPAITYQRIDGPREHCISEDAGMAHPRIQIDSWGKRVGDTKAVATQVRGALQRWNDSTSSPAVLDCLLECDEDSYESETNIYRVRQDWICWYREG